MVSSMLYSPIQTTCLKSATYLSISPRSILRVKISPLARSLLMWSWNVSAKSLITMVQIHSSVSLPPNAICSAISWLVSCTHALTQGPRMYPKNSCVRSNGVLITWVRRLRPWYRFQEVRNSSTWSLSPLKIFGSFPISLLLIQSGLGFGGATPDEQHRCMGLNSHGVSKVSVIDAAGVKQVEHKWLNVWDSRWENW